MINSNLLRFLSDLGLSATEQQLYLAGLETSEATVDWLIQKTGINRTTSYHALGTLEQKGFCHQSKQQGRLVYVMSEPADLEAIIKSRENTLSQQKLQLQKLIPFFPSKETTDEHIQTEQFTGEDGVKQAIEKALYCKSRQWNIIAPKDNFFSQVDKTYARYFMQTRHERGIQSRTLWETNKSMDSLSLKDLRERKPRYLPPEFSKQFKSVVILFDNKALFITSKAKQTAVIVHSREIVQTLSVMFEALWSLAEKPFSNKLKNSS